MPSAATTSGARKVDVVAGLAAVVVDRLGGDADDPPVRSSRTGPVTVVRSRSRAPAFSACRARISSKSIRVRTRP